MGLEIDDVLGLKAWTDIATGGRSEKESSFAGATCAGTGAGAGARVLFAAPPPASLSGIHSWTTEARSIEEHIVEQRAGLCQRPAQHYQRRTRAPQHQLASRFMRSPAYLSNYSQMLAAGLRTP
jgi:hypothetical protein